ncbi:MAG: isoleucine--tRNA ligase, partial [Candidatus Margulisbacteria bacterium]|nr:isoleucine--tRNA ligase [Candidatus Margulisiibacteriota bacterium]
MSEKKKYKDTLNLPKTDFPIKANLNKLEPEILAKWEKEKIYEKIQAKTKNKGKYILHDGPPYPNGDIHLGHTLNKTLKDVVVKYKTMQDYNSPFVPGWDCHGLPIEIQLLKELKEQHKVEDKALFREHCKEYALKYVDNQREQFKRLGVRGDWGKPYLTLHPEYEAQVIKAFGELAENGYVYKGSKPIHWCASCRTALAEAEIEYEDKRSPSIYIRFLIEGVQSVEKEFDEIDRKQLHSFLPKGVKAYILVWTTTPWTLPANVAIAVNPKYIYVIVKDKKTEEVYIMAESLVEKTMEKIGMEYEITGKLDGDALSGIVAKHPFIDRDSPVVAADYVTAEEGTGCVHIAPGHGQDDHVVGQKYNLPTLMPVDDAGVFTKEAGKFAGMNINDANKAITEEMKKNGSLLKLEFVKHAYPHCWRCKQPVIFRATPQWFVAVDIKGKDGKTIREKALAEIDKAHWYPAWGKKRIYSMIENRPDWCVSRQRSWGIPIPVLYCKKCEEPQLDRKFNQAIVEAVRKEGTGIWFKKEPNEFLPDDLKCTKCGHQEFIKDTDIMDVWMESGASAPAVLETNPELSSPADLYLEGSDQHRGWFHSSLLIGVGTKGVAPYKAVLTHGFTIDEKGRKLSKSLGNVVPIAELVQRYGADILRLWVVSTDFRNDMPMSENIMKQIQESFMKIRNTWRFLLSNLYDYDPKEKVELNEIDKLILLKLKNVVKKVTQAYETFEYHKVYHTIYDFCVNDLSSLYLDINKDNLYCNAKNSNDRKSTQSAFYQILLTLVKMMAPILTFTCEDIWKYIYKQETSVQLEEFPKPDVIEDDEKLISRMEKLLALREIVYKELEEARAKKEIAASLDAEVEIIYPEDLDNAFLEKFLIVSKVKLIKGQEIKAVVKKASGEKCDRCWKYDPLKDGLCPRCAGVVS